MKESCTMLFISIAAEGFLVVKINEIYWFFTDITMAILSNKIKVNELKNGIIIKKYSLLFWRIYD